MSALAGTGALLRVAARRDRVLVPVSALALTALSVGSAQATVGLYTDAATAMAELGPVLASPSAQAMYGPATTTSLQGLSIFKTLLMGAMFVGLLAVAIVRRHTRAEEEDGRLELVGAGAVGRAAPLTAAVVLSLLACLLVSALSVVGLVAIGFPAAGSVAFGGAWLIAGLTMTGVTAVAAQLTASARGAMGWAIGTLIVLYVLRAMGDLATTSSGRVLRWVSPFGWVSQVFPYGRNRSWLVLPAALLCVVLVGLAFVLRERRDLGAGLLPSRPGPEAAGPTLSGVEGLVWRLGRVTTVAWLAGFALLGTAVGGLLGQVDTMLADERIREMLAQMAGVPVSEVASGLADVYAATMLRFLAVAAAAAGIALVLHLSGEERSGRADEVLAGAVSRHRWFAAHVGLALASSAVLLVAVGLVIGARGHAALAAAPTSGEMLATSLEAVPATWVLIGAAALLAGASPRLAPWSWGVLGAAFVLGEFGNTLRLPAWLVGLSPFDHIEAFPVGRWDGGPVTVLTVLALGLVAAGATLHRRRDLG